MRHKRATERKGRGEKTGGREGQERLGGESR